MARQLPESDNVTLLGTFITSGDLVLLVFEQGFTTVIIYYCRRAVIILYLHAHMRGETSSHVDIHSQEYDTYTHILYRVLPSQKVCFRLFLTLFFFKTHSVQRCVYVMSSAAS